jgi:hypothetical protein
VKGFGPLRGEWTLAADRVNLVVDDNESGKSSLLAAITAALYGLEDDRRSHRVLTPLERWRPWAGGEYGVELELAGHAITGVPHANASRTTLGKPSKRELSTSASARAMYGYGLR